MNQDFYNKIKALMFTCIFIIFNLHNSRTIKWKQNLNNKNFLILKFDLVIYDSYFHNKAGEL